MTTHLSFSFFPSFLSFFLSFFLFCLLSFFLFLYLDEQQKLTPNLKKRVKERLSLKSSLSLCYFYVNATVTKVYLKN